MTDAERFADNRIGWAGYSSYLAGAKYYPTQGLLIVAFHSGEAAYYHPVSKQMAMDFFNAPSKGTWMWDHIRIRGTKHGHKVAWGYQ